MPNENSPTVNVSLEDVMTIISWWRSANEAPGGCSPWEAIRGMRDAVWNMELARREQFEAPFVHHPDCHHQDGSAMILGPGGMFACLTCERRKTGQHNL